MKKILKFFAAAVGIFVFVLVGLHVVSAKRLAQAPAITVADIAVPDTPDAIERGRHLATSVSGCTYCHGQDFSGDLIPDGPPNATVVAPNLTSGKGGVGSNYSNAMWIRAIAHGVGGDGRALIIMPSINYAGLSANDIGALVAFMKSLPPVDKELESTSIGFPSSIIFGLLAWPGLSVNAIDHANIGGNALDEGDGRYLIFVSGCHSCHGNNLAGLTSHAGPPPGPNLTTVDWTTDQFIQAMSIGKRPDGTAIQETMPWRSFGKMTRPELAAIWDHVTGLPERELGDN